MLRLIFFFRFPGVVTDSFVYGDIAKNWLQHGIYGLSGTDEISATYVRLPGYPAFLAFIFSIFGIEHYRAALVVQIFVDIGTCFLCADIARRLLGEASSKAAFLLAALCPFLADYSAAALTETLEVFFTALTLDLALAALQNRQNEYWAACGAACGATMLLRPDGTLLVIAIVAYLVAKLVLTRRFAPITVPRRSVLNAMVLFLVVSLIPLLPWTLRNWRTFHRFQPLAPRYANEENEFVPIGFNHWVKSWIADYSSVEEIYWPVPGSTIDPKRLPSRAFDNEQQKKATELLIDDYNHLLHVSPQLDARFEALAAERIHARPERYYADLPLLRILDMWLRPRTEMLPCDSRWWEFNDEPKWSALAVAFAVINLGYVLCALVGWMRSCRLELVALPPLFVLLRSAFLGTLENPEPRYTLEMYPVVIVFAAAAVVVGRHRKNEALTEG
jgi:4-amino-4-deoxy-L-arabinose transferase-like glycosyltransferase